MRTLIVEDVDSMRELLEYVIQNAAKYGSKLQFSGSARNGAEARFELMRRRPDLVLLDEVLPGESSLDLLEEFQKEGIPVVLLTSLADRTPDQVSLPSGALDRLFKPEWRTVEADAPRFCQGIEKAVDGRSRTC